MVPRPDLGLKYEMLLAANAAVATQMQAVSAADLLSHDRLMAHAKARSMDFVRAGIEMEVSTPDISWAIALASYLKSWDDGGAVAIRRLGVALEVLATTRESLAPLALIAHALQPLVQAHVDGLTLPLTTQMAECADDWWLLSEYLEAPGHLEAASDCALVTATLLRRCHSDQAAAAGQWAVRLLHEGPRSVALARTPRAKYPPRPVPPLAPDVTCAVCMGAIEFLFLEDGPSRLAPDLIEAALQAMISDPDHVIQVPLLGLQVDMGEGLQELPAMHFELRLARSLILRMQRDALLRGTAMGHLVIDLVGLLIEQRHDLMHRRDSYQHDWFDSHGRRPMRDDSAYQQVVACVQSIHGHMLVIIGELASDIDEWQLYERHAQTGREALRRARSQLG